MLLGKRLRPPMRRTTSVTELAAEALGDEGAQRGHDRRGLAAPRSVQWLNFSDFELARTAQFLGACGLCKRHLGPGLDTFIYRGEIAFCSLECRQHQMNLDDQKEKCSLTSLMTDAPPATAGSDASSSHGETFAAA